MPFASVSSPRFPAPLKLPVSLIPVGVNSKVVVTALSRLFAVDIREGELDFMESYTLKVEVLDAGLQFRFGMEEGKLMVRQLHDSPDITLKGNVHDFLLLASRSEDADTLFFQRRLKMEGNTDLGLEVKNFLDGIDLETRPVQKQLAGFLKKANRLYEKLF